MLPRVIGQGRASELLFTGRNMTGEEAERWGFLNRICAPESLAAEAVNLATELASGPTFAHAMTKKMLHEEWNMGVDQAIDAEAQAQAICMATNDFDRAYHAFVNKQKPDFKGD
jgi:enoyl-CoA hydratase/carnithine racemase